MDNGKYIYIQEEDFRCPTFDAFDNFMMMAYPSLFDDIHPDLLLDHDLHNPNFFSSNQNNPINLSTAHQNDSTPPNLLMITAQNNTQSHLHHHHNTNLSFGLMNDECAAVNVVASSGTSTASLFDDRSSLLPTPPPPPRARGRGRPPEVLPPGLPRPLRRSAAPPPPPPQLIPCQRRWTYTPHQGFPDEERKKYFRRDGMTDISDDQIKSSKGKKQLILGPQQQEQNLQLQAANLSSSSPSKVVLMGREWGVMDAERLTNSSSMEEPGGPNSPILIDIDPDGLQSWKLHSN